jgi:hypothetical protein
VVANLYGENPFPIALGRANEGDQQKAGRRPHDGKCLRVIVQAVAQRNRQREEKRECGERDAATRHSKAHDIPPKRRVPSVVVEP